MILIWIVILLIGLAGLFIYFDTRNKKKLPKKIETVRNLVDYLNSVKIQVHFCEFDIDNGISCIADPATLNIFGLSRYRDKTLNELYEDDVVLFNPDSNRVFDLDAYMDNEFMPKIIREELLNFHHERYKVMEFADYDQPKRFVNIRTGLWRGAKTEVYKELLQTEAPAFESWQEFKDCAEQLEFVILQWLKDAGVKGNDIDVEST